jgi:UDP-N-acetyl-alpha-D-muramoyl-L-alanyl-L-glutamate epimerase
MARSSRQSTFVQLRQQFPFFTFESQEYSLTARGLDIRFTFNLADLVKFHPTLFIPRRSFFLADERYADHLGNMVFNIGMIELISYWKAACAPKLIVKPFALDPEQAAWWKKLYFNGLGEFFYLNSLDVTEDNFMQIDAAGTPPGASRRFDAPQHLDDGVIIPVGGGKDSAVTLELLGNRPGTIPLIMNPRGASLETIAAKGFSKDRFFEIRRTIDPELLRLNDRGFLNGHTPFSALLAFVTVLAAIMTGRRHIALSNESSANEATIEGTSINHQYSKSFQFESDFRGYVKKWICKDVNYFSFLRPLNELQIAFLFSGFPQYQTIFRSCNAGSKTNSWCGTCAKCLFTCIILSPFLTEDQVVNIFGTNIFEDKSLMPLFDQLTGVADEKPFDCIGTVREVNLALCETIRQRGEAELPFLLACYRNSRQFLKYGQVGFKPELLHLSAEHHLKPEFLKILNNWMLNRYASSPDSFSRKENGGSLS